MARFYQGYPWRFIVVSLDLSHGSDVDFSLTTFLDHWATNRNVRRALNDPWSLGCRVPSESPEVNIAYAGDGLPFVAEGTRAMIGLRREGGTPPWRPRASGIISQPTDNAEGSQGAGNAYTDLVAFDPWRLMYRRPVRLDDGELPGVDGRVYPAGTRPSDIVVSLLELSELHDGPTYIDLTTGTIETVPVTTTEIVFQYGMSVGEALKQLCDDGYVDLLLQPIYDPIALPGKISQLNVYAQAGTNRYEAVFAWNLPSRSLAGLSRLKDGTERANKVQFYNGQGGPPVALQTSSSSVARYGPYWLQEFFPGITVAFQVEARAAAELNAREDGLFTITGNPAPERSPIPLADYDIGDSVPIYASAAGFREVLSGLWRVTEIPIDISDAGIETVQQLQVGTVLPETAS